MANVYIAIGCVAFGMFLVGFFWGYIFGEINKNDEARRFMSEVDSDKDHD